MESPNLDETRRTLIRPEEESAREPEGSLADISPSSSQELDPGVTQRAHVSPTEQSIDDTQLSLANDDGMIPPELPDSPMDTPRSRRRWILWAFFGVLILVFIAAGSAYAGYNSAIDQRTRHQSTLVAGEAANQYILAQQDIAIANFDRARQRLEYIIQIDPNYPGVREQLAYVLTQQRITATPTLAPTPTLTPTPDFRTRDELFAQAQSLLIGHDWTAAIDTLLMLRKNYADFMPVKVDGMLFVALRNRGIDKIAQLHDLEGGNYDLTLAERFGPLDAEANNWREWAELYIRGASFWGVDWGQAVFYFSQLASAAPGLSDISGWTASNRYLDALLGYGNWFAAKGEWCDAQAQFDMYMSLLANPQVEPTAVYVAEKCAGGAGVPEETGTPEFTVTPGGELTPTPTETPVPTETPTTQPYP